MDEKIKKAFKENVPRDLRRLADQIESGTYEVTELKHHQAYDRRKTPKGDVFDKKDYTLTISVKEKE